MSKGVGIGLIFLLWGGVQTAQSQELPFLFSPKLSSHLRYPMQVEIPPMSLLAEEEALRWQQIERIQRYAQEDRRKEVTRANIDPLKAQQEKIFRESRKVKVNFRITAGNTAIQNWSPYPDRALDARVIRYPMRQPNFEKPRK